LLMGQILMHAGQAIVKAAMCPRRLLYLEWAVNAEGIRTSLST